MVTRVLSAKKPRRNVVEQAEGSKTPSALVPISAPHHESSRPRRIHWPRGPDIQEVQVPTPAEDEVLVQVRAVFGNLADWGILTADPLYITVLARMFGPKPFVGRRRPGRTTGWAFQTQVQDPWHGMALAQPM